METHKYQLYAVRLSEITHGKLKEFEYSLCANNSYALIYTEKELDMPYCIVDASIPLLNEESQWLAETKAKVNLKVMQKNENEYTEMLSNFCNAFEKELKKEKRKENKKNKIEVK